VDGVLVIDKPGGVTSHDVVSAARRILNERRIGHGGTLDPLATGVLVLLCGRATRLARFVSASEKAYDATILFGVTTDSYDVTGTVTAQSATRPTRAAVERAIESLRGHYDQLPPAFSAKKVAGARAYDMARRQQPVALTPVPVSVTRAVLTSFDETRATVEIVCSAGFYVRSFAHTLGELVESGACLEQLRRTRSGDFTVTQAVELEQLQGRCATGTVPLIPLTEMMPWMPGAALTAEGRDRVAHGRIIEPRHLSDAGTAAARCHPAGAGPEEAGWCQLIAPDGELVAIARSAADGTLHPSIVLI